MAARKWTVEQRAEQAIRIKAWKPWCNSTGARSIEGKAIVSRNAYRGGMRPFLRLINQAARAFSNLGTMTVEKAEAFNNRMTELCAKDYEWRNSSPRR